jgi:hypothetical protein
MAAIIDTSSIVHIQGRKDKAFMKKRSIALARPLLIASILTLSLAALLVRSQTTHALAHQTSQTVPVFAQPNGYWLSPPTYTKQLYGPTWSGANWNIEQWGTPTSQLPSFRNGSTSNSAAGATVSGNGMLLNQSTAQASCGTTVPPEFDLFAAPNITKTYPGYPSAALDVSPSANLSALSAISFGITLKPLAMHTLGTGCQSPATAGVNQGVMMGGVILSDPTNGQTFFYQIQFAVYRLHNGVTTTSMPSYFYFTGANAQWGYDDDATVYGEPQATVGTVTTYSFSLLSRLDQLIKKGRAYGMDQNLANWSINGAYYGNCAWGHVDTDAQWQNFSLTVR